MVGSVSKDTAKLLKDVTGESHLDSAVRMTVKDALEHRLERIEAELEDFREKYEMEFEEFTEDWESDEIENKYSYNVEKDYREWEGLHSRKEKIQEALERIE